MLKFMLFYLASKGKISGCENRTRNIFVKKGTFYAFFNQGGGAVPAWPPGSGGPEYQMTANVYSAPLSPRELIQPLSRGNTFSAITRHFEATFL